VDWFAAIVTRANAASALTTLLGGQKIYPENAPQNTARPYVTLLDVTQLRPQTLKSWDLEAARVQVDVWADTYKLKNSIMEAVLTALVPGGTYSSHVFQRADIDLGPRDVAGERDGDTIIYRKTADLIIHHT
jgi:Protein of unknown function (DUF3168)